MIAGNPAKALIFFAAPLVLGNLFQQFYTIVDSVVVGKFVGENALAAVGASYSITNIIIMIAIGGGMGSSVIISQYFGAGQRGKMKTAVNTALWSFLGVSVLLAILGFVLSRPILLWMETPQNVLRDAVLYLKIYFAGLPFVFMYNVQSSVFQALGDSKRPLYLLIFSSLLNIALDLLFVLRFHMGIAGVAYATFLAQGLACGIAFFVLRRKLREYSAKTWRRFDGRILETMVKVAVPSILQQSIVSIGMLLVQAVVNSFGSSVLAGYTAGMRIESICIMPMIALGNAMSTFTAQNIGAGTMERVKRGYRFSYLLVAVVAAVTLLLLQAFSEEFIVAFLESSESQAAALSTGTSYLFFMSFFFFIFGSKIITDGVLRGAGDVVVFTVANLVNLSLRVVFANVFAPIIGIQAVWMAVPIGWSVNFLITFPRYLSGKWREAHVI